MVFNGLFVGIIVALSASLGSAMICETSDIGLRFSHPTSCSKFYQCDGRNQLTVQDCPRGLHFDRHIQMCDFPSRVKCMREGYAFSATCEAVDCDVCCSVVVTTTYQPPTTTVCITDTVPMSTPTIPTPTTTTTKTSAPPTTTTTAAPKTTTTKTNAPPTTTTTINVSPATTTTTIKTTTTTTVGPTTTTTGSSVCDPACCGQQDGNLVPVEGVCSKFYNCVGGKGLELSCPNNLHFSTETQECMQPSDANCPWPYVPPSGPTAGPSGTYCASGGDCVNQLDGYAFIPGSQTCSSNYIVCQCECEIQASCPDGLVFNTVLKVCDWPANVKC